jgi:predicted 3-demethylubiquinone-9 3-methyltransferase (glyoxalase superfamily)
MQRITPCLWFDSNALAAAKFYTKIFSKSKVGSILKYDEASSKASGQKKGSVLTVNFKINGQEFVGLNGGPIFKPNPSISFMVPCKTAKDVDALYKKLSKDGEVMMALDKYPFNERYTFFKDKFGVSWQLIVSKNKQIAPSLLFVNKDCGNAKPAVEHYRKIFKKSKINQIVLYGENQGGKPGTVMFCSFMLEGQEFTAMDGPGTHQFTFNEGTSFMITCKNQAEIDYYWNKLTADGGQESVCGWLKDKYGVSWQVAPIQLLKMHQSKDKKKAARAMKAMMQMKKIDLATIEKAFKGVQQ